MWMLYTIGVDRVAVEVKVHAPEKVRDADVATNFWAPLFFALAAVNRGLAVHPAINEDDA